MGTQQEINIDLINDVITDLEDYITELYDCDSISYTEYSTLIDFAQMIDSEINRYNYSEIDWEKIPTNTKVIVTGLDGSEWHCHFCKKYDWRTVLVFHDGKTSWTTTKTQDIDIRKVRLA